MSHHLPLAASLFIASMIGIGANAAVAADTVYPPSEDTTPGADRSHLNPDQQFVNDAAHGGLFEVQSSKIALDKSVPGTVHDFATHMIADHSPTNDKLAALARSEGYSVPDRVDPAQKLCLDKLSAANGDDFVKDYDNAQRKAHDDAITAFENESARGQDLKLRNFASDTLPTLRHHREMINGLPELDQAPAGAAQNGSLSGAMPQDTETPPGAGATQSKSAPLSAQPAGTGAQTGTVAGALPQDAQTPPGAGATQSKAAPTNAGH